MGVQAELAGLMKPHLEVLLPALDEKARRLVLGAVALAAGDGGIGAVARVTGASWQTVADGAAELASEDVVPQGRVRRPGGGRKKLAETDPGLVPALLALVEDSARGDPESPLAWTTKSAQNLSGELARQGHRCSPQTVWRLLGEQGFSTQANAKVAEGKRHPDRDGQFRYIAGQAGEHLAAGQPVISVDAKKKELVGQYGQAGREWRRAGDPVRVRDHDFEDPRAGHAIPYGVYDVGANTGFVNVGTDHNTAAFAVESIRRWWDLIGKDAYPGATRLLVTCDAGSSNGWTNRAWKAGLADLAQQAGLEITACHFPPGTSKWNKVEHRLFSQISLAWRARPLTSHDVIISTIGAVTTATGLTVTAVLDDNRYPTGARISDAQVKDIEDRALTRHAYHGGWNYTFPPVPRPAPPPPPPPPPPGLCDPATLNHPALTGLDPAGLHALAAALDIPFRAQREQRRYTRSGRPRTLPGNAGGGWNRKLDLTGHVLATAIRRHLHPPLHVIAALLGADKTTISHAITRTRALLDALPASQHPAAAPPPAISLNTLSDLRAYAAGHDITIPGRPQPPADSTAHVPGTPETHVNLECLPFAYVAATMTFRGGPGRADGARPVTPGAARAAGQPGPHGPAPVRLPGVAVPGGSQ